MGLSLRFPSKLRAIKTRVCRAILLSVGNIALSVGKKIDNVVVFSRRETRACDTIFRREQAQEEWVRRPQGNLFLTAKRTDSVPAAAAMPMPVAGGSPGM